MRKASPGRGSILAVVVLRPMLWYSREERRRKRSTAQIAITASR